MTIKNSNPYQRELERFEASNPKDGRIFAETIIANAQERGIPVETDPEILRESGDLDLKNKVPPQVYAVVAGVMDMIRKLEEEESHESDSSHAKHKQPHRP